MRNTGTFRLIEGKVTHGDSYNRDGPPLTLSDDAGNEIVVQVVDGTLHVRGEGDAEARIGRFMTRRIAPTASVSLPLRQGSRVALRAGKATARLAYDPDSLLPLPLRVISRVARWSTPSAGAPIAACCVALAMMGLLGQFYRGAGTQDIALDLVRHRQEDGYAKATWMQQANGGQSAFLIEASSRKRAASQAPGATK